MTTPHPTRSKVLSEAGRLGAIVRDLGSTLDERRARTAPAREAAAAARARRRAASETEATTGKLAARIAAVEAALPTMPADEQARQRRLIDALRATHARLHEAREQFADAKAS